MIVLFRKMQCISASFRADFDFVPKNKTLEVF